MKPSMGRIMAALIAWFSEEGWPFVQVENEPQLLAYVEGDNSRYTCIAEAREAQEQVIVHALIAIRVPKAKRSEIAEYIARANAGVAIGSFDLDFDEGQLAYRTSIDVEGVPLPSELIGPLVDHAVTMADRHFPGIMAVLFGGASPVEALDQIERYSLDEVIVLANELLEE
jgi:hypothetical protein